MRQYFALRKLPHAPPQLLLFLAKSEVHVVSCAAISLSYFSPICSAKLLLIALFYTMTASRPTCLSLALVVSVWSCGSADIGLSLQFYPAIRPGPSAAALRFVSVPPRPALHLPYPHHSASQSAPNTSPYPAPKYPSPATHRKPLPPFFPSSRNQISRYCCALWRDQSSVPAFARSLPPAAAHFHGRREVARAIFPARSIPPLQLPPPAASPRQTSSGKSAPSR